MVDETLSGSFGEHSKHMKVSQLLFFTQVPKKIRTSQCCLILTPSFQTLIVFRYTANHTLFSLHEDHPMLDKRLLCFVVLF